MTIHPRPNILIVMSDAHRRDAIGCMHRDPVNTPHLDAFAAQGALCEQVVCNSPLCTPSRASFLTGRHPFRINMLHNWLRLPIDEPTLATACAAAGYDTAMIGKWHMDDHEDTDPHGDMWNCQTPPGPRRMGFRHWYGNGCVHDHWRLDYIDTAGELHTGAGWQVDHETDRALEYLANRDGQRPTDRPFCLWMNWSPPHNLCQGPRYRRDGPKLQWSAPDEDEAPYRDRTLPSFHPDVDPAGYAAAAPGYFGSISAVDRSFGRLMSGLDQLGLAENTIVLYTADHGEMLGIRGRWMKGIWYEPSIGVPFILRLPGRVPAGRRVRSLFGLVDAMPTILGLAGIPVPAGRDGCDRSAWIIDGDEAGTDQLLAYNCGAPPRHATRYDFPDESGRYWRGVRTPTHTYAVVDQRPGGHYKFYDPALPDALPATATRVAVALGSDGLQRRRILPGQGSDDLLDDLHRRLAARLDAMGDDFLLRHWAPVRTP